MHYYHRTVLIWLSLNLNYCSVMVYFSSCNTSTHWIAAQMAQQALLVGNAEATQRPHSVTSITSLSQPHAWTTHPHPHDLNGSSSQRCCQQNWAFRGFSSLDLRDMPNPPQLYFWLTTCWQNSGKPSLIRKHMRTCWISFRMKHVSSGLRVFPFQWKRKRKIFK